MAYGRRCSYRRLGGRSMTGGEDGRKYECVVVDVNTQRDFCDSNGAYPAANLQGLIPALRHMIAWAKRNQAPVISSIESHRPSEFSDNGDPLYCVDGSDGQRKIDFTMFHRCTRVEVDNTLSCPMDLFAEYQQVLFRKRARDLLGNPKADRFFTELPAKEFILFGVSIDGAVKALALALLAREKRVTIVVDACGYWNKATADLAVRQVVAKGAIIITVDQLLRRRLDRRWRYPTCRKTRPEADVASHLNSNSLRNASPRSHPLRDHFPESRREARMSPSGEEASAGDT